MAGPTEKSGTIATSEIWDLDGSPYEIINSITTATGADIHVEAGVEIEVQKEGATITLGEDSKFVCGGTRELPIWIHGQIESKTFWKGFVLGGNTGQVFRAYHTTIENAEDLFDVGSTGIELELQNAILRNCRFVFVSLATTTIVGFIRNTLFEKNIYAFYGRLTITKSGSSYYEVDETIESFRDNVFRENVWAICHTVGDAELVGTRCKFYRNKAGAIKVETGLSGFITLENSWWSNDSGPTDSGNADGTGELITNDGDVVIDYAPFWSTGRYVPIPDDAREFASRILREGTPSGEDTTAIALTDDELDRILDRAEKYVDSWLTDDVVEKRLLAYGEETNETRDRTLGENYVRTRYRPILAISSVERRTGAASWTAVSENELSGYYASETDKRRGLVHFASSPIYELDSVRLSYTHGYYAAPEDIRDAVLKLAAFSIFQTILKPGEPDAFTSRVSALEREIETLRERFEGTKKGPSYVVI